MKPEKILKLAIKKVEKNGWDFFGWKNKTEKELIKWNYDSIREEAEIDNSKFRFYWLVQDWEDESPKLQISWEGGKPIYKIDPCQLCPKGTKSVKKKGDRIYLTGEVYCVEEVIFSHEFARAFWPEMEEDADVVQLFGFSGEIWEWHLAQMILKEKPLEYIEQFL